MDNKEEKTPRTPVENPPAIVEKTELPELIDFKEEEVEEVIQSEIKQSEVVERSKINDEKGDFEENKVVGTISQQPDYVTREEIQELLRQAYLRGKNEAVEARIIKETSIESLRNSGDGLADDIASIFRTRPSVWGDKF